jgi:ribosomal protein S1
MASQSDRLKRLLRVQEQLKQMHEMRRAALLKAAHQAEADAEAIAAGKTSEGSLSGLFPDLYERAITRAHRERDRNRDAAAREGERIAAETLRTERVEDGYRTALRAEEREAEEKNALEAVERMLGRRRP